MKSPLSSCHSEQAPNPDHVIIHDFPGNAACPNCGTHLTHSHDEYHEFEVRQVFDFPPIELEVSEDRARRCNCPDCRKRLTAAFPDEIKTPVQYGPRVQAAALYPSGYQLLPFGRLSDLINRPSEVT